MFIYVNFAMLTGGVSAALRAAEKSLASEKIKSVRQGYTRSIVKVLASAIPVLATATMVSPL